MAVNTPETNFTPKDWFVAKEIGKSLFDSGLCGLDITTRIVMKDDVIDDVFVSLPLLERDDQEEITDIIKYICGNMELKTVELNRILSHGIKRIFGTSGASLDCDFFGTHHLSGKLSPWGKSGVFPELTLNLLARFCALEYIKQFPEYSTIYCSISCKEKSNVIKISLYDSTKKEIKSYERDLAPSAFIRHFHLAEPRFGELCKNGLLENI